MTYGPFARWLYRGQRPNPLARALNRCWAIIGSLGFTTNFLVMLEVAGRKTGRPVTLPVVIAIVDKQRYLVSMLGEDVQWVKNVRAANGAAVIHSGANEPIQLVDVPVSERAPILKAYVKRAPGGRPHIPVDMDAPVAEFAKIAADYPVFRIEPRPTSR
ncbi:MAG: nitroreductase family deazaflavin-dependent oxidoreductase [Anaerolineae bacterium]